MGSVRSLKGLFDPRDEKQLCLGDRILCDDFSLADLGLSQEAALTTHNTPMYEIRARQAAQLLDRINQRDLDEISCYMKPVDIICLAYHACILVGSVLYGEEDTIERIGYYPFSGEVQDLTLRINKQEVFVHLRPMKLPIESRLVEAVDDLL